MNRFSHSQAFAINKGCSRRPGWICGYSDFLTLREFRVIRPLSSLPGDRSLGKQRGRPHLALQVLAARQLDHCVSR